MRRPKYVEYMRENLQKIKDFKLSDVVDPVVDRHVYEQVADSPYFSMRLEDIAVLYKCAKESPHLQNTLYTIYYRCSHVLTRQDIVEWEEYKDRHGLEFTRTLESVPYLLWVLEGAPE